MKSLSPNWITEGLPDVEYKTYLLLAYFRDVNQEFQGKKIYPSFSDLYRHYQYLLEVKTGREKMKMAFPKTLSGADFENMKLEYSCQTEDDDFLKVMDEIIEYSIPAFQKYLNTGMELYKLVEENLRISEVGLQGPGIHEGYFFLCAPPKKEATVYRYVLTHVHLPDGAYRAIHVSHLQDVRLSFTNTFENLKTEIIRRSSDKNLITTYLIESEVAVPREESMLPVAKRHLAEYLSKQKPAL
jgi:hypothetical protein